MSTRNEPAELAARPPEGWLEELDRRLPDVDPRTSLPILSILNTAQAIRRTMAPRLDALGLTAARFTVVMMIHRLTWEAGSAAPSELARQAGVGRAAMTQVLDGLEAGGWIERRADDNDRRRIGVTLTTRGRKRLESYLAEHYAALGDMLSGLSGAEQRQLMTLLEKVEYLSPPM